MVSKAGEGTPRGSKLWDVGAHRVFEAGGRDGEVCVGSWRTRGVSGAGLGPPEACS